MASWVPVSPESDFSLSNLPYGVFSTEGSNPRIGVAIGDSVLSLSVLAKEHVFDDLNFDTTTLQASTLNEYAALGRKCHRTVRSRLIEILKEDTKHGDVLRDNQSLREQALVSLDKVQMHLPMKISEYTDFFVGLPHAETVSVAIPSWLDPE
jgi:fumarylacetoacetase